MKCISTLAIVLVAAGCASPAPLRFGLFSDLAYRPQEEPLLENVFDDLNRARLDFVVHLGDLGAPTYGSCTNELWAKRRARFEASVHPLVYTPGDNEWTDCHEGNKITGFDPLERLASLREFFFAAEGSMGRRTIPLVRQSTDPAFARYRENARWSAGGVTFITLHVVGSNNGLGISSALDDEHADRMRANVAWLAAGFAAAKAAGSRAVMVLQQANIFPEVTPFPGKTGSGTAAVREALEREVLAFGKPVVLAHGDSHYFRVDKPLGRRFGVASIANFTRVETFGSATHHWVEVTVERDDPNIFTFRPRIVEANVSPPSRRSP